MISVAWQSESWSIVTVTIVVFLLCQTNITHSGTKSVLSWFSTLSRLRWQRVATGISESGGEGSPKHGQPQGKDRPRAGPQDPGTPGIAGPRGNEYGLARLTAQARWRIHVCICICIYIYVYKSVRDPNRTKCGNAGIDGGLCYLRCVERSEERK